MKIAIIGKDSYIGNAIDKYLSDNYSHKVDQLDVQHNPVDTFDFSGYEAIIHVAAIVHRTDIQDYSVYRKVNVELPVMVAQKAKSQGVKHMIFLSSMSVFGKHKSITQWQIDGSEELNPYTLYGKSKLEAERELTKIQDNNFIVSMIRPPSVYGRGCKGNLFSKYYALANKLIFVPNASPQVKQGVLHIDNLCLCVGELIDTPINGILHPQDSELLSTGELLSAIRMIQGKKKNCSKFLGKMASVFRFVPLYKKLYGAVTYTEELVKSNLVINGFISTEEGLKRTFEKK